MYLVTYPTFTYNIPVHIMLHLIHVYQEEKNIHVHEPTIIQN